MIKKFVDNLKDFIQKKKSIDLFKNELCCDNCFKNQDSYSYEKSLLNSIRLEQHKTTTEKGDLLEDLIKNIFNRISLINSLSVTNKDTALGQLDLILTPVDNTLFDIWGLSSEYPSGIIGECKNYKKPVERDLIEKFCWRVSKGHQLGFFIAPKYSEGACKEIGWINQAKELILVKHHGVYIIPITLEMIEAVIENDINFCYFIQWLIKLSKNMEISNYLSKN